MDNNPVITPQPNILSSVSPKKSNMGRNLVMIISAILIVIIWAATGYLIFLGNAQKTVNNKIEGYVGPTIPAGPTATPTPSVYQINPKDTSDSAITSDTTAVNHNLNSLDSN